MENILFEFTTESLLFFFIMAAETIENFTKKRPNPMQCKGEIPDPWPVIFLAKGTKKVYCLRVLFTSSFFPRHSPLIDSFFPKISTKTLEDSNDYAALLLNLKMERGLLLRVLH
jgi:hypothetical protein